MTLDVTAPVAPLEAGIMENEFEYVADGPKDNIIVELTFSGGPITLVCGVLV